MWIVFVYKKVIIKFMAIVPKSARCFAGVPSNNSLAADNYCMNMLLLRKGVQYHCLQWKALNVQQASYHSTKAVFHIHKCTQHLTNK
jgi:hypothetical protein